MLGSGHLYIHFNDRHLWFYKFLTNEKIVKWPVNVILVCIQICYFDAKTQYGFDFFQNTEFEPEFFQNIIVCEKPNNDLNRFKGYM